MRSQDVDKGIMGYQFTVRKTWGKHVEWWARREVPSERYSLCSAAPPQLAPLDGCYYCHFGIAEECSQKAVAVEHCCSRYQDFCSAAPDDAAEERVGAQRKDCSERPLDHEESDEGSQVAAVRLMPQKMSHYSCHWDLSGFGDEWCWHWLEQPEMKMTFDERKPEFRFWSNWQYLTRW